MRRCPLRCALCDDCVAELVRQTREAAKEEMTKALARARREALAEAASRVAALGQKEDPDWAGAFAYAAAVLDALVGTPDDKPRGKVRLKGPLPVSPEDFVPPYDESTGGGVEDGTHELDEAGTPDATREETT